MGSLTFGLRIFLALVFLSAALPKLGATHEFRRAVRNYGLLPERLVETVARTLPWAEVACSVSLLLGIAPTIGAGIAAAMLAAFASAAGFNLLRGRSIECGCSGPHLRKRITWSLVLWDVGLSACAAFVASQAVPAAIVWAPWETHVSIAATAVPALAIAAASFWLTQRLVEEGIRALKAGQRIGAEIAG